jgi:hypothetical protein
MFYIKYVIIYKTQSQTAEHFEKKNFAVEQNKIKMFLEIGNSWLICSL